MNKELNGTERHVHKLFSQSKSNSIEHRICGLILFHVSILLFAEFTAKFMSFYRFAAEGWRTTCHLNLGFLLFIF